MRYCKGRKARRREKFRRRYNRKLLEKYPWLTPRNVWTDKLADDYRYEYTWYDDIPDGWAKAFGMMMVEEIDQVLRKGDYREEFRFHQIKEKWGFIHVYHGGVPEMIYDELEGIIRKYEVISAHTCFRCGKPDVKITDAGWVLPLCEQCYNANKWRSKLKNYADFCSEDDDGLIKEQYTMRHYSNGETAETTYDISDTVKAVRMRYEERQRKKIKKEENYGVSV